MADNLRKQIADLVKNAFEYGAPADVEILVPEKEGFGHYSTNAAMRISKEGLMAGLGKDMFERAQALSSKVSAAAPAGLFDKVEAAAPGFVNFWLSAKAIREAFDAAERDSMFGRPEVGAGRTAIVEYSSPNIAKPFHLGHLRNTIIGDALANILGESGYKVVRWNYLGDWGTQFGKLIAAYKLWGSKDDIAKNPIGELQKLYVRFHEEAERDPKLDERGREEFKKLEDGDEENRKLWEWFKKESLAEFKKIYDTLGVVFSVEKGESSFDKDMKPLAAELAKSGVAERSEGALIIRLDEFDLPPALIEKSDGASVYLARDIANLRYRLKEYEPAKILYVVGNEQSLAFSQLFAVAKKLGMDGAELIHIKYGLVLGETGKKLSTRRGDTVTADEVIGKAVALARKVVDEKARDLTDAEKDDVARAVALGALKYNDLKENRMTDIVFDWERMLDFTGDSGPYLEYTHARLRSILRKAGGPGVTRGDRDLMDTEPELALMRKILEYPDAVRVAGERYATSILAGYLYKLAVAANKFYETTPIMQDENAARRDARLGLVETTADVMKKGLALLGIEAPDKI